MLDTRQNHAADSFDSIAPRRRIRHITSVQIRNLTPFPARDALASVLSKSAEQLPSSHRGHTSDDLDLNTTQKRSRKISITSIRSFRSEMDGSAHNDEANVAGSADSRGRTRTPSKVSSTSARNAISAAGVPSTRPHPSAGSAPTIRPRRGRTASMASSIDFNPGTSVSSSVLESVMMKPTLSALIPDHSQASLEKIIHSRLVETFLAATVVPSQTEPSPSSPPLSPASPTTPKAKQANGTLRKSLLGSSERPRPSSPRSPPPKPHSTVVNNVKRQSSSHSRSASLSPTLNSKPPPQVPLSGSDAAVASSSARTPDYLSPIHRPSTNPSFMLDPKSEFSKSANLSEDTVHLQLWAKTGPELKQENSLKGKEKATDPITDSSTDWRVLKEWEVNLSDLSPLPDHVSAHLPSNSLLVTLSPPDEVFYLPWAQAATSGTRSPSPSAGYNSDPESDLRATRPVETSSLEELKRVSVEIQVRSRRRQRPGSKSKALNGDDVTRTASWQDLFQLATLKSCIVDNEASLEDITRGINEVYSDPVFALSLEINSREFRLEELRSNHASVGHSCSKLRDDIAQRRERIRQRKEILALARQQHEEALTDLTDAEDQVIFEQESLDDLRSRFTPTRTTLLSTLSTIYPIDLLSPPDLLYTILDVPLPIPVSPTDPAPPLQLPRHQDINEDTIATALGYAAQLIQLIAAYMGKILVYPITYIGSRSLIRDGISAMVGPRMFPLFSRGVDTYRFEYGVFLLNKNIEMLMADHDLRALDMRHTLPNLKNLLLTLTNGEGAPLMPPRATESPTSSLESPRAASPELGSTTPKNADHAELPAGDSASTFASGSTTPTLGDTMKKSRPLFGLSFPSGFLRSRTTSTASPAKETENHSEPTEDDEEDRRTIREADVEAESHRQLQGNGHAVQEEPEKSLATCNPSAASEPPLPVSTAAAAT